MRLRAPAGDGEALVVPPLRDVGDLIARNRPSFAAFLELRTAARSQVLAAARAYHAERGEPMPQGTSDVWLVSGHQPELFHPGVWVKNFALNGLARQHRAIALNLIVDNDTVKSASVRVPTGEKIAFDRFSGEQPWEERPVIEPRTFAAFPERVAEVMSRWGVEPVRRKCGGRCPPTGRWAKRLVAGRRAVEREWGCHNLEVPLSRCLRHAGVRGVRESNRPRRAPVRRGVQRGGGRVTAGGTGSRATITRSRTWPRDGNGWNLPLWAWPAGAVAAGAVCSPDAARSARRG